MFAVCWMLGGVNIDGEMRRQAHCRGRRRTKQHGGSSAISHTIPKNGAGVSALVCTQGCQHFLFGALEVGQRVSVPKVQV